VLIDRFAGALAAVASPGRVHWKRYE
jgi:hypothetical protein